MFLERLFFRSVFPWSLFSLSVFVLSPSFLPLTDFQTHGLPLSLWSIASLVFADAFSPLSIQDGRRFSPTIALSDPRYTSDQASFTVFSLCVAYFPFFGPIPQALFLLCSPTHLIALFFQFGPFFFFL